MKTAQRNQTAVDIIREHFGLADTPIKLHQALNGSYYVYWADSLGDHHWDVETILWRSRNVW